MAPIDQFFPVAFETSLRMFMPYALSLSFSMANKKISSWLDKSFMVSPFGFFPIFAIIAH
jgi:hypothetical protein